MLDPVKHTSLPAYLSRRSSWQGDHCLPSPQDLPGGGTTPTALPDRMYLCSAVLAPSHYTVKNISAGINHLAVPIVLHGLVTTWSFPAVRQGLCWLPVVLHQVWGHLDQEKSAPLSPVTPRARDDGPQQRRAPVPSLTLCTWKQRQKGLFCVRKKI